MRSQSPDQVPVSQASEAEGSVPATQPVEGLKQTIKPGKPALLTDWNFWISQTKKEP